MSDQVRKLQRNTEDKMIAGVASGVADFFQLDTTLVRTIWALSILLGGFGLLVYIVLWIVLPVAGQDETVAHDLRDKMNRAEPPRDAELPSDNSTAEVDGGNTADGPDSSS